MRGSIPKFGKMTLKPHTSSNIEKSENIVCLDIVGGGYFKTYDGGVRAEP